MDDLKIINQHQLIRDTIGYDAISGIDVVDLPDVLRFLKIVDNYSKICRIINTK